MEPFLGFALLAFLVVFAYLALEKLIEHGLKTESTLVHTILRTIVLVMIGFFVYHTLPFFSEIFYS